MILRSSKQLVYNSPEKEKHERTPKRSAKVLKTSSEDAKENHRQDRTSPKYTSKKKLQDSMSASCFSLDPIDDVFIKTEKIPLTSSFPLDSSSDEKRATRPLKIKCGACSSKNKVNQTSYKDDHQGKDKLLSDIYNTTFGMTPCPSWERHVENRILKAEYRRRINNIFRLKQYRKHLEIGIFKEIPHNYYDGSSILLTQANTSVPSALATTSSMVNDKEKIRKVSFNLPVKKSLSKTSAAKSDESMILKKKRSTIYKTLCYLVTPYCFFSKKAHEVSTAHPRIVFCGILLLGCLQCYLGGNVDISLPIGPLAITYDLSLLISHINYIVKHIKSF